LVTRIYITGMKKSKVVNTKTDRNIAFGLRLKDQRKAVGLTQDELAEVADRSTEAISKMERGLTFPSVGLLITLAEKLNTSVDFLLGTEHGRIGSKERIQYTSEAIRIITELEDKPLKTALEQLRSLKALVAN
jgi:transcriptional regulator with XRE-family HTH domain